MKRLLQLIFTICTLLFVSTLSAQCPGECSAIDFTDIDGSTTAVVDINSGNYTVGGAQLTITQSFAGTSSQDENVINASQTTGDLAIRLGVSNAITPANQMTSNYNWSQPVCGMDITIWDIDKFDEMILTAYNGNTPVSYTTSNVGSCVSQSGTTFVPNGPACEIQISGLPAHAFDVSFNGCIDRIQVEFYDQGGSSGGSYSTVFGDGCTEGDAPDAGSLVANSSPVCYDANGTNISASQTGGLNVPSGFGSIYVLSSGAGLVIEQVSGTPSFSVNTAGPYTIHTLVYDPATFNLATVIPGQTTGFDVAAMLVQGGGSICAALDVAGAPILVNNCNPCDGDIICSAPDFSNIENSATAIMDINSGNYTVAGAQLTITQTYAGTATADENVINASQTSGALGIRLGVSTAVGAANYMESYYNFSAPVCNMDISLWDIDQTDEMVLTAFNGNTPVSYTVTGLGSCVSQSANVFNPNGVACEVPNGNSSTHAFGVSFDSCIDKIVVRYYDQGAGTGGSYTTVFGDGCMEGQGDAPSAGTISPNMMSPICYDANGNTISATADGNMNVPAGYSTIYVLTSGAGLVIEQVNGTPSFSVNSAGQYTIHTLVYDPATLNLGNIIAGQTTAAEVVAMIAQGGGSICASLDVAGAPFLIESCNPCDDGNMVVCSTPNFSNINNSTTAIADINNGNYTAGGAQLTITQTYAGTATPDENVINASQTSGALGIRLGVSTAVGAANYMESYYNFSAPVCGMDISLWDIDQTDEMVLTAFNGNTPVSYTVTGIGSCVSQSANVFNPNGAACEVPNGNSATHAFDVSFDNCIDKIVVRYYDQGAGTGGSYTTVFEEGCSEEVAVDSPVAGTLTPNMMSPICFEANGTIISATPNGNMNVPTGYSTIYVLTSGAGLVIEQVNGTPSFSVNSAGQYAIHTLVYDPATLNLGNIVAGQTTAAEVAAMLVQGGGSICASLDEVGAPFMIMVCSPCDDDNNNEVCSTPDFTNILNSTTAIADINGGMYTVANSQLTITQSFGGSAGPDENVINASQTTGDVGIRLGVVDASGAANYMESHYNFSAPVCNMDITIWDIDQTDEMVLTAFNGNTPVSYSTTLGSCVSQSANTFIPNGAACNIQVSGVPGHAFDVAFNGCIDKIVVRYYDQGPGNGGSYTTVFGEGCSEPLVGDAPEGGTLAGGPFEFCSDAVADNIPVGAITLTGESGPNCSWIVTDDQGIIIGLPLNPSDIDFDVAAPGTCYIWNICYEDGLTGLMMGANTADLDGCYDVSNPISVIKTSPEAGTLVGGPFEFCVGDGVADNIPAGAITLSGNNGANCSWIVTDDQGMILGLPTDPSDVDFDTAAPGTCLVWHICYEDGLAGLAMGMNASDLDGCYDLSNPISVERTSPESGTIAGGPFEFCVGDGVADNIPAGAIVLAGNSGTNCSWIVTDDQGMILGLPADPSDVDFDTAAPGTCLVWHICYEDGLAGLAMGMNAGDLTGCYDLSNPIEVIRNSTDGGTLTGGPFEFCVGDGVADNIPAGAIVLAGNIGSNGTWVVTDDQGNILGLPADPSDVDFDIADPGTCLIWYLSYEDGLQGLAMGMNASGLIGCYSLSNPISVERTSPESGTIAGGPFEFCVGDGVADNIPVGSIVLAGNSGTNCSWIVTDDQGMILGLPADPSDVDFDTAAPGTCLVWHICYEDGLAGLAMGMNASDLVGCYELSNPIPVVRNSPEAGTLAGGPFEFCVGDGVADNIPVGSIILAGNSGANGTWVVTDDQGNILGLPASPSDVNFDIADPGTCLIWYLSYEDGLQGLAMGMNASDLVGCYSLSNPISVERNSPEAGAIAGGPFEFCVGDGVADNIPPGSIVLAGNSGSNCSWIVTDDQGMILGLPADPSDVDFDGADPGSCLVWHICYEDGLAGLAMGMNASDLAGCYDLSNPIEVIRSTPDGGTLMGGPFEFCVGDGVADYIPAGSIVLTGNVGANGTWVVTDDQGIILGLPTDPSDVNFDSNAPGTCLIYWLSYEAGVAAPVIGDDVANWGACSSLSNAVQVIRNTPEGGTLAGGPFEFCVGDGVADFIPVGSIVLAGNSGANSAWVITDDQGNILGLPGMPGDVDFDVADPGSCLIWNISYEDGLTGLAMGANAGDLEGCYDLSNPIEVIRNSTEGGTLAGGPFEFCVGDGVADYIPAGSIVLAGNVGSNGTWVVTDDLGNILGLPNMPSDVNFDVADPGTCLIWYLSYEDGLTGLAMGANAADLAGCYSLSNSIEVVRNQTEGGTLTGGPFEFCVGDGFADNIPAGAISLSGNIGSNGTWVVTDDLGNILGLPNMPSDVNFDVADPGTCLIWYLSYEDGLTGLAMGANASDLDGCFSLSNSIEVLRDNCCEESAGTITPVSATICVETTSTLITATPDGNSIVPPGFSTVYILADGLTGVIIELGLVPTFTVTDTGLYVIHTLVYDPITLDITSIIPDITTVFDIDAMLFQGGGMTCASLDLSGAVILIEDCAANCTADAGTLTAAVDTLCLTPNGVVLTASSGGNAVVPAGYSTLYVLTTASGLIIQQTSMTPAFTVTSPGDYIIHTLIYDPATLDLSGIALGQSSAFGIIVQLFQGGGIICGSLDVLGAPTHVEECNIVCEASAGTIGMQDSPVCYDPVVGNQISAVPAGNSVVPAGYTTVYVLTSGSALTVVQAGTTPSFAVSSPGTYTIHTLVYDPLTLNFGMIIPGVTTGFDVSAMLLQGGGDICGSLDVAGAEIVVEDCSVCLADAGTISPSEIEFCYDVNGTQVSAMMDGNAFVPAGFNTLFILTSDSCTVQATNTSPSFNVNALSGYVIHTFVYDPATYDVSTIVPGSTCDDINDELIDGGGSVCGSLDLAGAPINVIACDPCPAVDVSVMSITESSAILSYTGLTGNGNVTVTNTSTGTSTTYTSGLSVLFLVDLEPCNSYEVTVDGLCYDGSAISSATFTFETDGCIDCTTATTELSSFNVTGTSAALTWSVFPGATYTLYFREQGEVTWNTYDTPYPVVLLIALQNCVTYEWAVVVNCIDGSMSELSDIMIFESECKNQEEILPELGIEVYPNPASDVLYINNIGSEKGFLQVQNMNGQIIDMIDTGSDSQIEINVSQYPRGTYNVTYYNGKSIRTTKVVITE